MNTERLFPVGRDLKMPWEFIAPHEKQALKNHEQTLAGLAKRGGLAPVEAWLIVESRPLKDIRLPQVSDVWCVGQLREAIERWRKERDDG